LIPLKNDEVLDFLKRPSADFSASKNAQATIPVQWHRWNKSNNTVN